MSSPGFFGRPLALLGAPFLEMITIGLFFALLLTVLGTAAVYAVMCFNISPPLLFRRLSGLPLILFAITFFLDKFHPSYVLILPLMLSLISSGIFLALGLGFIFLTLKRRERVGGLVVATFLAGVPLTWFLIAGARLR